MEAFFVKYGLMAGFIALVLTPFGLPIPEEISLLSMGLLLGKGHSSLLSTWILGFLGVTLGDVISWYFGKTLGLEPKGFVSKLIGHQQIEDIEQFYRRWGDWAIVFARQIPGMRFPTFFFAGASAVPLHRFYLIDGLAALVTVNLYLGLGYYFADDIQYVRQKIDEFIEVAGFGSSILLFLIVGFIVWRRFKNKKHKHNG